MNDDTPWLDEQEMLIWRGFIEASVRVMSQLGDELKTRHGLTMDDYEVLVNLSEADDLRLRMSDLSRRLLHSQSRSTQRIDRLAKRGLVVREKCADDGRGTFAVLTAEGLAAITEAAPHHVRQVREILIDLIHTDERTVFADVMQRVAAAARSEAAST